MVPIACTALGTGASLAKDKCVRTALYTAHKSGALRIRAEHIVQVPFAEDDDVNRGTPV
jgi:hypothetical protein